MQYRNLLFKDAAGPMSKRQCDGHWMKVARQRLVSAAREFGIPNVEDFDVFVELPPYDNPNSGDYPVRSFYLSYQGEEIYSAVLYVSTQELVISKNMDVLMMLAEKYDMKEFIERIWPNIHGHVVDAPRKIGSDVPL
jgi:hypothetical protein